MRMGQNPAQIHDCGGEPNLGEPRQEQLFDAFPRILSGSEMPGSVQKTETHREFESCRLIRRRTSCQKEYRKFEFTSLRHAVRSLYFSPSIPPKRPNLRPNSGYFSRNKLGELGWKPVFEDLERVLSARKARGSVHKAETYRGFELKSPYLPMDYRLVLEGLSSGDIRTTDRLRTIL